MNETTSTENKHRSSKSVLSVLLSNHTNGPWELIKNSWAITTIYAPDKQGIVCELRIDGSCTEEDQQEREDLQAANAKLIEMAPAMYQRLQFAQRLLLQEQYDEAMEEILLGLQGVYER